MLNANWEREGIEKKYRLKPYWGNPTVRNFRGSGGNVGIIEAQLAPLLYSTLLHCPCPNAKNALDISFKKLTGYIISIGYVQQ
jgi:hypothetical protein